MYIRCIYGIFGREIIKYTVIYGVYIRFWPTLAIHVCLWPTLVVQHGHTYIDMVNTVCTPYIAIHRFGQNHIYIRCIYGIFGREIIKYTVYIYGSGQPILRVHIIAYVRVDT